MLRRRPVVGPPDAAAAALLAGAYADHCLDLAGPPPPFDAAVAAAAAGRFWFACWYLLQCGDEPAVVERSLALPPPTNPSQHLSADLTLRFLPQVHRRAHALAAADPLTGFLARLLREWPLSGALSDAAEPPLTPPDFHGHAGLLMLYAERLAANPRPAWVPAPPGKDGLGRAYVELALRPPRPHAAGAPGRYGAPAVGCRGRAIRRDKGYVIGEHGDHRPVATRGARAAQAALRRPRRGRGPDRAGGRGRRAPVPVRPAGDGQVGPDPPVRPGGARPLFRVPADALLGAQRNLRPHRHRPPARGHRGHRHHRHAARGRVRLPRRAVQRQQRHPQQPADGPQRARSIAAAPRRTGCRCCRCSRPRTTCRTTTPCGPCSTASCCAATWTTCAREAMPRLLAAGWALEQAGRPQPTLSADDLRGPVAAGLRGGSAGGVGTLYAEVVFKVRDLGIALSDRRAVKVLKLLAASALLCGRTVAAAVRPVGAALRLGPGGADRPAGGADQRRAGAARRRARRPIRWPPCPEQRRRRGLGPPAGRGRARDRGRRAVARWPWPGCASASPTWPTAPPGWPTTLHRKHLLKRSGELLKRLG